MRPRVLWWMCVATLSWSALAQQALVAQRTWVVDRNGGAGVDYTDIPPAIAAASPGDRIVVRALGDYSGFVLDRGLDLDAPNAAVVPFFTVRNVPATQRASVSGFIVWEDGFTRLFFGGGWVEVSACTGPVLLRRVTVETGGHGNTGPLLEAGLLIQDSAHVLLLECLLAPAADVRSNSSLSGHGLLVRRSAVTAQRSRFVGAHGFGGFGMLSPRYPGAHGALVLGPASTLLAVNTTVIGGIGGAQGASGAGTPQQGGHGVAGDGTAVFMASSVLTRGDGGGAVFGPPGPPGFAADGPHQLTADCTLTGALNGGATSIAALTWIRSPGEARLGQPVTLDLFGAPGTAVLMLFDASHTHISVPGLSVPLLLQSPIPLQLISIGASGQFAWTLNLPADPLWRDQFAFFQGVALPPSGPQVTLTNLGDLRLR